MEIKLWIWEQNPRSGINCAELKVANREGDPAAEILGQVGGK